MMSNIDISQIRAVRNHNPVNIRIGSNWVGLMPVEQMTPEQKFEHSFCVFIDDPHGFRAAATILKNYKDDFLKEPGKYFCVQYIIERLAPPNENNTQSYINHVAQLTGFDPMMTLIPDAAHIGPLCKACSTHEVGCWAFKDDDLAKGLTLAGL